jgi:hypothetical protein
MAANEFADDAIDDSPGAEQSSFAASGRSVYMRGAIG